MKPRRSAKDQTRRSGLRQIYNLLSREAYFARRAEQEEEGAVCGARPVSASIAAEASAAGQGTLEHLHGVLWAASSQRKVQENRTGWRPTAASNEGP